MVHIHSSGIFGPITHSAWVAIAKHQTEKKARLEVGDEFWHRADTYSAEELEERAQWQSEDRRDDISVHCVDVT